MGKQGLEGTKTLESELWAWEREKGRLVGRQPRWLVSRKKTIRVGGRRGMARIEWLRLRLRKEGRKTLRETGRPSAGQSPSEKSPVYLLPCSFKSYFKTILFHDA